jgi:hypothetical protein
MTWSGKQVRVHDPTHASPTESVTRRPAFLLVGAARSLLKLADPDWLVAQTVMR